MIDNLTAKKDFEVNNNIKIVKKEDSWFMKLVNVVLVFGTTGFMENFITTYRLPFQKQATIAWPGEVNMKTALPILEHEMFHVRQFKPWYGPICVGALCSLLPLPFVFSGRWFVERHAYLNDIAKRRYTVEQAVDLLWSGYGWCWPKSLMRKWFIKQISKMDILS